MAPAVAGIVLAVTHGDDDHAGLVIEELSKRAARVARFDTESYPDRAAVVFDGAPGRVEAHLRLEGQAIRGRDIGAVFYRHRRLPQAAQIADREARRMAESELLAAIDGALLSLDAFWLNHPIANRLARHKPLQLSLAVREGFRIPETRITNDPEEVRRLYGEWEGRLVAKLAGGQIAGEGHDDEYAIYTTRLREGDLQASAAIAACPAIYQRLIEKAFDLRVTVVGDQIFACRIITPSNDEPHVDWRRAGRHAVSYEPHDLDPVTARKCRAVMRRLGLELAGIDMIVTPDDETVFLELNAAGQWAWIEQATGMPIAAAVAERLIEGANRHRAGPRSASVRA